MDGFHTHLTADKFKSSIAAICSQAFQKHSPLAASGSKLCTWTIKKRLNLADRHDTPHDYNNHDSIGLAKEQEPDDQTPQILDIDADRDGAVADWPRDLTTSMHALAPQLSTL